MTLNTAPRLALFAGLAAVLFGLHSTPLVSGAETATSPTLATRPALPEEPVNLKDLPGEMARALKRSNEIIAEKERLARQSLSDYLQAEVEKRYLDSYDLICEGSKRKFLLDETIQAIISDIGLYRTPPATPNTAEKEAIDRISGLVAQKKLSLDIDEPGLWAFQFVHVIGSVEAQFESTGPYTNEFLLSSYKIADLHLVSDDLASAWVTEDIAVPVNIKLKRLSIFLLKPEGGKWRIFGHRGADGPRMYSWLGMKTTLWPDQLEIAVQDKKVETD